MSEARETQEQYMALLQAVADLQISVDSIDKRTEAALGIGAVRLRRGVFCAHVPVSLRSCRGSYVLALAPAHTLDRNDRSVIQLRRGSACLRRVRSDGWKDARFVPSRPTA